MNEMFNDEINIRNKTKDNIIAYLEVMTQEGLDDVLQHILRWKEQFIGAGEKKK